MKTAIGKMWQRRITAAIVADMRKAPDMIRDARLELGDLLDHAGPRALRNKAAHDIRELLKFAEDFGLVA